MKNLKGILLLAAVVTLLMSVNTVAASSSILMQEAELTTIKRAVFGAFLSALVVPSENPDLPTQVDTAISISNCTISKEDVEGLIGDRQDEGAFHILLVNTDGSVTTHESGDVPGNQGDDWDGILEAGETWTARLFEILLAAGKEPKIDGVNGFQGYAWVCSEFDCLAGSYTVTIFGVGFNSAFEFLPGMGQGGNFGGIALPLP